MGIFASKRPIFSYYQATLRGRGKIMAATPNDPKSVERWLSKNLGLTDEAALAIVTEQTLREIAPDLPADLSGPELIELAAARLGMERHTNVFKRGEHGLYLEARTLKANLKEAVNILFPYPDSKWGSTKKAPRSYFAENVFVYGETIWLGRHDPDGVDLFIGHPSGPRGRQSNLTNYEYVVRPEMTVLVMVLKDRIKEEWWEEIWQEAERLGLGALRSQGYGVYDVTGWDRVERPPDLDETAVLARLDGMGG